MHRPNSICWCLPFDSMSALVNVDGVCVCAHNRIADTQFFFGNSKWAKKTGQKERTRKSSVCRMAFVRFVGPHIGFGRVCRPTDYSIRCLLHNSFGQRGWTQQRRAYKSWRMKYKTSCLIGFHNIIGSEWLHCTVSIVCKALFNLLLRADNALWILVERMQGTFSPSNRCSSICGSSACHPCGYVETIQYRHRSPIT